MSKEELFQFIANAEPQKTFDALEAVGADISEAKAYILEHQRQNDEHIKNGTKFPYETFKERFEGMWNAYQILLEAIKQYF
jgi:hypothetical protein